VAEAKLMKKSLNKTWAFLTRDVRTFLPNNQDSALTGQQDTDDEDYQDEADRVPGDGAHLRPETLIDVLPPLIDGRLLHKTYFRRKLLDWRDESIQQIHQGSEQLFNTFMDYVGKSLSGVNIFRIVIAENTDEMIIDEFDREVRGGIQDRIKLIEVQLNEIYTAMHGYQRIPISLIDEKPDPQLDKLARIKFRPSNKEEIRRAICHVVLGEHGIADKLSKQIMSICKQDLESLRRAD